MRAENGMEPNLEEIKGNQKGKTVKTACQGFIESKKTINELMSVAFLNFYNQHKKLFVITACCYLKVENFQHQFKVNKLNQTAKIRIYRPYHDKSDTFGIFRKKDFAI